MSRFHVLDLNGPGAGTPTGDQFEDLCGLNFTAHSDPSSLKDSIAPQEFAVVGSCPERHGELETLVRELRERDIPVAWVDLIGLPDSSFAPPEEASVVLDGMQLPEQLHDRREEIIAKLCLSEAG